MQQIGNMRSHAAASSLRRRAGLLAVVTAILLALPAPAQGKIPPFEIDVDVDGTVVDVTVTFDEAGGFDVPELEGIVAIYPEPAAEESGRQADSFPAIDVPLVKSVAGIYGGQVDLEAAGRWVAVSMPGMVVDPALADHVVAYPEPVPFQTTTGTPSGWAGGLAVLALSVASRRLRRVWAPVSASDRRSRADHGRPVAVGQR